MTKGAEVVRKTSTELTSLSTTVTTILGITDLALRRGGGHFAQVFLVFRVGGVLCQLVEDVGARRVCDVKVMSERRAIRGRTGEGMLFVGLILKETRQKKIFDPHKGISLYTLLDKKTTTVYSTATALTLYCSYNSTDYHGDAYQDGDYLRGPG